MCPADICLVQRSWAFCFLVDSPKKIVLCGVFISACSEGTIPPMTEVGEMLHFIIIVYLCLQDFYVVRAPFLMLYFMQAFG